jgi:hypothetical protein
MVGPSEYNVQHRIIADSSLEFPVPARPADHNCGIWNFGFQDINPDDAPSHWSSGLLATYPSSTALFNASKLSFLPFHACFYAPSLLAIVVIVTLCLPVVLPLLITLGLLGALCPTAAFNYCSEVPIGRGAYSLQDWVDDITPHVPPSLIQHSDADYLPNPVHTGIKIDEDIKSLYPSILSDQETPYNYL